MAMEQADTAATDGDLIARLLRGDIDAAARVYDRFAARSYSLARRILADDHLAQDVVQEVFVTLWRDVSKFNAARGSLSTWLLTLTHHRAVDAVRREESLRRRQERHEGLESAATSIDHVDDQVSSSMRRDRVRGALQVLPPPQREALTLSYFGGYTQREIASLTGTPLGTVKTRMLLGMARLRTSLADDADVSDETTITGGERS